MAVPFVVQLSARVAPVSIIAGPGRPRPEYHGKKRGPGWAWGVKEVVIIEARLGPVQGRTAGGRAAGPKRRLLQTEAEDRITAGSQPPGQPDRTPLPGRDRGAR